MIPADELIVDSFAGGGGASTGIFLATGRHPDIAVNHDADAIAMHAANHPSTRHYTQDVFSLSPDEVTGGQPVGLLWLSPDCRHFSRAKGGKPVAKGVRGLAWVAVKWAAEVKPRVLVLENVREFENWGPLVPRWACRSCDWKGTEGQVTLARKKPACPRCESKCVSPTEDMVPCPRRKGLTFRQFVGRLRGKGYAVAWRVLNAADFGAPTHRRRLFLVARQDALPIEWPEPTHGDPKRVTADAGGLFADDPLKPWRTAAECIDWSVACPSIFERKRPLAEKTLRRIALGIKRYVLDNPTPFVVDTTQANRPRGIGEPLGTVTTQTNKFTVVTPTLINVAYGDRDQWADGTTHSGGKNFAVVAPVLYPRNGERPGQAPRCGTVEAPLPTVVQTGNGAMLAAAMLLKHFGGVVGHTPDRPLGTVTAVDHHSLAAASLVHLNHGDKTASGASEPTRTVTASGTHAALVYAFLTKYFGNSVGQLVDDPLGTVTGKDRFGLVTVTIAGEPYVIADIGMRMLRPRELANAQGFPADYVLTGTATSQVKRIGNSVCPQVAAAVVRSVFAPAEVGAPC